MNSNLFLMKVLGGVATTAGISAGGYFAYKNNFLNIKTGLTKIWKNVPTTSSNNSEEPVVIEKETYLLSLLNEPDSNIGENDLYIGEEKNTKNYQCKLFSEPNTVDTSCELFSLPFDRGRKYFGDLKKINQKNILTKNKSVLRENTFYKLIINKSAFTADFDYGKTVITLNAINDVTKSFGKMTVLAKLNPSISVEKKWVLAKANSEIKNSQTDLSNFSCKIGADEQKDVVNCTVSTIFKLRTVTPETINFASTNSLVDLKEVKENSYYIMDFSGEHSKTTITDEKLMQKIVYSNTNDETEKIDFEFTSYLAGVFDKNDKNNNKIFVLKDLSEVS